jgi:hypothetical protein
MRFKKEDIEKISKILKAKPKVIGNSFRFVIKNTALEIYPRIKIGKKYGTLVSVYTPTSHLQLHFCTNYVVSELLGEVTFISDYDGKISGLIVERTGGCSLYANIDRELLSGDFTQLAPQVMLSGIALSLAEPFIKKRGKKSS